ncbi:MAG: hypothetical protein GEU98_17790 [Pseudonocardiaceae bacterium]|nr:hypothetical protein [Pseudonocardiaceae bacterium]
MIQRRTRKLRPLGALVVAGVFGLTACGSPEGANGGSDAEAGAELPSKVEMVIPYSEGGGTDTWARFMIPYLEKHIKGDHTFVPENVPGGESITGTNQFVQSGGTDGGKVLVTSGTTYIQHLLGRKEVQYDFSKMRPLLLNGSGGVIYASRASGIKSVEDLRNPPQKLSYAGISATGLDLNTLLAFDVLGIDLKATFGFEGRGPARLALERGEVNVDYQTSSAYKSQVEPMVKDGKAVPLMSFGLLRPDGTVVRDPNFPNLPTVEEVHQKLRGSKPSGKAYQAYKAFLGAGFAYTKGIWVNEGTPDSVVRSFYDAIPKIDKDKDFVAKSEEVIGGYDVHSGQEIGDAVNKALSIDESKRNYVLRLLERKYDTKLETK